MDATTDPSRDRLIGILLIVFSSAMFAVLDGLSKILVATASPPQIVWARYVLGIPLLLLATRPSAIPTLLGTSNLRLQILRGLTPLVISLCMVIGVRFLPLADTTVILFASPFLVVALSVPFLGEKVRPSTWAAVAVGFLAVIIVARPGVSALSLYAILPLVAAIFYAILTLITRRLAERGERPRTTLAWTLLTGGIVSTPVVAFFWNPLGLNDWLLMLSIGTVFGIAQLTLIAGLTSVPASIVAPLTYVQVAGAVIFGVLVLHETPDAWTWLGIAMILASGLYVARRRS